MLSDFRAINRTNAEYSDVRLSTYGPFGLWSSIGPKGAVMSARAVDVSDQDIRSNKRTPGSQVYREFCVRLLHMHWAQELVGTT
jgi:hypothetical protein